MGRARVEITEIDLSARVPSFPGLYTAMVLDLKKGEVLTPRLNTDEASFFKRHTLNGRINPGDSLGLFEAQALMRKNNKLWTVRPDTDARYGGAWLAQDVPYHTMQLTSNQGLSTFYLRQTTAEDKLKAALMYSAFSDGDVVSLTVSGGVLPEPLLANTSYYLAKRDNEKFGIQLAPTLADALAGSYFIFQTAGSGTASLTIPQDKLNGEQEYAVRNPKGYELDTSDGRPAGFFSDFHVDMDGDFITVDTKFWNTCETGDEAQLQGALADLPQVDAGLALTQGQIVYVIKTQQEGQNADKFKVQIARSKALALSEDYIGFKSKATASFGLQLTAKLVESAVTIDVSLDIITVVPNFYKTLTKNDLIQIKSATTFPQVGGTNTNTSTVYYAIVGAANKMQLATARNGTAVNFSSAGTDVTLVNTSKSILSSSAVIDMSKDSLSVSETFYEQTETGFVVTVKSDGTLPSGLQSTKDYYVIKTDTIQVIQLASSLGNANAGMTVDIIDLGTLDSLKNQYHYIYDKHNAVLSGFGRKIGYLHTATPCEEEIYYRLVHYPYGSEDTWSDTDQAAAETVKEPGAFKLFLYKEISEQMIEQESYVMSRNPDHRDGYGQNIYCEKVSEASNLIRWIDNAAVDYNVQPVNQLTYAKLTKGSSGVTATTGMLIIALKQLRNKRRYPVTLIMDAGWSVPAYQQAIIDVCESRGSTVGIFSTPISIEQSNNYLEDLVSYRRRQLITSTSHAALYSPHLKIYDEFNDREIYVSPTGHVGAQISYTAANFEPWYAPAGNRRGVLNVLGLSREFNEGDMDYLYDNGINPIEFHETKGIRIWGQKTLLNRPSALDRLNVRMLLVVIEPAIEEFLDDFVFEFNDALTRLLIVDGLNPYLENIKRRRGLYAYSVVCDDSNNGPEIIDANEMYVDIFIQPVRVAELIHGRIIITKTGASFNIVL
jgi:hypothetical protein